MGKIRAIFCIVASLALVVALLPLTTALAANSASDADANLKMQSSCIGGDCEPQWFLTDDYLGQVYDTAASTSSPMYEMVRGDSNLPEGDVEIASSGSAIWRADMSTPDAAAFGGDPWTVKIMLRQAPCQGNDLHVYLGYIVGNDFTQVATGNVYKKTGQDRIWWFTVTISQEFTVPAGGWLAFKIVNETCRDPLEVRTGQSCGWVKPRHCPTYPVPELQTIALMGVGILAICGGVWLSRRRKVA